MTLLTELGKAVKGVFMSKVPVGLQTSGYYIGERVEYNDRSIRPVHQGTVVRIWEDKVKVVFDGFELGVWMEQEAIKGVGV